jgi:hypothetical protein
MTLSPEETKRVENQRAATEWLQGKIRECNKRFDLNLTELIEVEFRVLLASMTALAVVEMVTRMTGGDANKG